jgi:hypothetical protein
MRVKAKTDRGVAGLTILLSLVTMLFVIGLLVMIFSLMGGEMRDATYTSTTTVIANETITGLAIAGDDLAVVDYRNVVCSDAVVINATTFEALTVTTDYVVTDCNIIGVALSDFLDEDVKISYSYTYDADNTATNVMNDTSSSIATVTDWFPIFIVIGAMVVLILLTVIIISSIRGSGLMGGESA